MIIVDAIIEKALDITISKALEMQDKADKSQAFDAIYERSLKEYRKKYGDDDLYKAFFCDGFDRQEELKRIVTNSIPSREVIQEIFDYVAEESGFGKDSQAAAEFTSILISELQSNEEFAKKFYEIRHDHEMKQLTEKLDRVIFLVSAHWQTPMYNLAYLTNPPIQNSDNVLYREKDAERFTKLHAEGKTRFHIRGMGGIGKTAFSCYIFHKLINIYKHAAWIEYDESLKNSILKSISIYKDDNDEQRYKQIKSDLINLPKETLIFVDNISKSVSEDDTLKFLSQINATVVINSRFDDFSHFTPFDIGFSFS